MYIVNVKFGTNKPALSSFSQNANKHSPINKALWWATKQEKYVCECVYVWII